MTLKQQIEADIADNDRAARAASYRRRMAEACAIGEASGRSAPAGLEESAWSNPVDRAEWIGRLRYTAGDGPDDQPDPVIGEAIELDPSYLEESRKGSLYLGLCKTETGLSIPDDVVEKRRRELSELKSQTLAIAEKLEGAGVQCFRNTPFSLWHFYVHSGHLERIPSFRRTMVLPYVAASVRAPMLAAVESFLERNPLARFWTFTSGPRCRLLEVRDRLRRMHRRLSQLNAQPFMQSAGVEIVFRSSELGTPETHQSGGRNGSAGALERDAEGLWFHVHAHTIVCLKFGYIAAKKWEHLIRQVWNFWGHHWDAGDSVRDARECLKYVTKPGEMLKLTGEELAALAHQLRRIKLAQPMGILATEIKGRAALGNRLIKVQSPEGRIYKEVKDWNKLRPVTQDVRDLEAARRLSPPRAEPVARIVSRLLPAVGPRGVKEPRVIVMTAGAPDIALLRSHAAITPIIRASADEFAAGLRIRVHTCTATVLTPADWIASEHWPPPTAADLAGFSR